MTREEAIVDIRDNIKPVVGGKSLDMAIKALEQKWIPVSERLPEIHNYMQEYIVTIKGNFIRTAFFTETNGKSWWSIDDVIAWMPLPEPYKAESEVQE